HPANIHAGGLRYHGSGTLVAQLMKDGLMEAMDVAQTESFKAGVLFARTEGIIPAPESCHAIAATIREAEKCKISGEKKTILFNLSGHGFVDMAAYGQYLNGDITDYVPSEAEIQKFIADADALNK
ncbi:MAG: pyridoxal-phosphate dependent enzyme, partial [Bacteroidales bacterium]|nr:pyridoxal-phosphate dependent enzyme [Bacteroidales bacterium]